MKRVTVSIDEKWWGAVRVAALRDGKPVGKFLMGLFDRAKAEIGYIAPGTVTKVQDKVFKTSDLVTEPVEKAKTEKIADLKATGYFNPMPKKGGAK